MLFNKLKVKIKLHTCLVGYTPLRTDSNAFQSVFLKKYVIEEYSELNFAFKFDL